MIRMSSHSPQQQKYQNNSGCSLRNGLRSHLKSGKVVYLGLASRSSSSKTVTLSTTTTASSETSTTTVITTLRTTTTKIARHFTMREQLMAMATGTHPRCGGKCPLSHLNSESEAMSGIGGDGSGQLVVRVFFGWLISHANRFFCLFVACGNCWGDLGKLRYVVMITFGISMLTLALTHRMRWWVERRRFEWLVCANPHHLVVVTQEEGCCYLYNTMTGLREPLRVCHELPQNDEASRLYVALDAPGIPCEDNCNVIALEEGTGDIRRTSMSQLKYCQHQSIHREFFYDGTQRDPFVEGGLFFRLSISGKRILVSGLDTARRVLTLKLFRPVTHIHGHYSLHLSF
ncbi:hypothetical protein Pelo_18581 [Pelomyxa schiedti]|nr:hypothetical protein Pelo_18581 [Pelomyxa schiedti]